MTTAEEIAFLEERKAELLRLKKLRDEVAALERESLKIAAESAAELRLIVLKVCEHWHTEPGRLINFDRHEPMAIPRHVARYLARELTRLSFPELAVYFGRKNHATVIYSVRYVCNRIDTDAKFREVINHLKVEIAAAVKSLKENGANHESRNSGNGNLLVLSGAVQRPSQVFDVHERT